MRENDVNNINFRMNGNEMIISVTGKIDSSNAAEAETAVNGCVDGAAHETLTLDFEGLEYISSAGLRVILRLRKSEPSLNVINASSEVYEILDMTGFTEMIPVKKAYRRVSVDGCKVIGRGAVGTVYRLDDDIIVKVYGESDSLQDIHRERELARKAFVLGIPTAIPFDVVKVGDCYGSVFELLKARSLAEIIIENPEKAEECIDMTVELMLKLHSAEVNPGDLPAAKDEALRVADYLEGHIDPAKAAKFKKMAREIPDAMNLLHGDLHIKNIMVQNGEALLIDMDTLCHGHPLFELASIHKAYIGYGETDKNNSMDFFGIENETACELWEKSLQKYLKATGRDNIEEIADKIMLMAYAMLFEYFDSSYPEPDEKTGVQIQAYRNRVLGLIDAVDSFDF